MHFYFPNASGDYRLRFSAVASELVYGVNRRTMGIVSTDVFDFDNETNYMLIIKFDKDGFYVNDHLITRDDFVSVEDSKNPEVPQPQNVPPRTWTYPDFFMNHFQNVVSVSFGSREGSVRSYAYYEYIMYHHNL